MKTIKKQLKRAFTIVELVIVIAVIAVLAAVLIPTFVNVLDSANESVDEQAVKNMNTALIADETLHGIPEDPKAAMEIIESAGYNVENYVAQLSTNTLYYDWVNNRVLIWSSSTTTVTYPAEMVEYYTGAYAVSANWYTLSDAYETVTVTASTISTQLTTLLSESDSVILKLSEDVELTSSSSGTIFSCSEEKQVTVDLNEKTLTLDGVTNGDTRTNLTGGASLYIKNGTIEGEGITASGSGTAEFKVNANCSLTLENVIYNASGSALFPNEEAAQINVINSTIIADGAYGIATNAASQDNYGVYVNVVNSTIESTVCGICWNTGSTLNISDSTIKGVTQGLFVRAGTVTVANTEISCTISAEGIDENSNPTTTSTDWVSGTGCALGAVVVGNKNGTYYADAVLTMSGCSLSYEITDDTSNNYSAYKISLYAIEGSSGYSTIATISDCDMNDGYVINYNDSASLTYNGTETVYKYYSSGWSETASD